MKNIDIANTHRTYRKFVGHVIAQSGLLAFIANTLVVPAGLIVMVLSVASGTMMSIIVSVVMVGFIGVLLALLSDGMTLSACARLRMSMERIALIKQQYAAIPDKEKKDSIIAREEQEKQPYEKAAWISRFCILFFSAISSSAGTLFWHRLLASLPEWQAWTFSSLFSLLISGTLIACELYKKANNEIVREAIVADHFTNEALLEDANEEALKLLHDKYKIEIERIGNETQTVQYAIEEHAVNVYDNLLGGGKGLIPARIQREKIDKEVAIELDRRETERQLHLIEGTVSPVPQLEQVSHKQIASVKTEMGATVETVQEQPMQQVEVVHVASDQASQLQDVAEIANETANERTRNTDELPMIAPKSSRKRVPVNEQTNEAAKKMRRILRNNPNIGPTELATRCGCSKSYASRFKSNFLATLNAEQEIS